MRVLITGANGFVGTHLCPLLAARGHEVIAAVRAPGVTVVGASRTLAVGDIHALTDWRAAVAGCAGVIHLAARAHRGEPSNAAARQAFKRINLAGSAGLIAAALEAGIGRCVFLSSSKVYGERSPLDANGLPQAFQADSPLQPSGPYGESKAGAEAVLAARCGASNTPLIILRPPLVYGPGHKANLLALMQAIARGWPLPLAAIHNQRSLIYVGNLVTALALALESTTTGTRYYPLSDVELSTPDLVRALARGLQRPARLVPVPTALLRLAGMLTGRRAAIARLTDSLLIGRAEISRDLGWSAGTSLRDAMRLTGEWFGTDPCATR
ncbi:MAG: NAD-dependent epimerase/dehydratase family protein [Gammaproteobacteria bacterium]|nr:NAD-dependent epimerase/dehydratase family protein [Gammaproteobacteria bacterium]